MASKEQVIEMLETVFDPEVGVDIWTMGLIYDISIKGDKTIAITMTFTTPLCPLGQQIKEDIQESMRMLGFEKITITVTFDPPWQPSEELRQALGI